MCALLQTEFLLCMHKRMEDILKQAELVAHCVAAGTAAGQQDGGAHLLLHVQESDVLHH